MRKAQITGTGGYQPGSPITNDEILDLVGPLPDDVMEGLSIQQRFWMIDPKTGEHLDSNSSMAAKAARRALESAGVDASEVDAIIMATGTPDFILPPAVNLVQDELGLDDISTLEIRSAGAGTVQALEIARQRIEQGRHDTVLVIGSEVVSPVLAPIYLDTHRDKIRMRDRIPLYMFSDGAGSILVQGADSDRGLHPGIDEAIGGGRKPGIQVHGGGTSHPLREQLARKRMVDLRVDVVGAAEYTPKMVYRALTNTLASGNIQASDLDWCLIPEGNVGWLLESMESQGSLTDEWKALDGRIFDDLAQTGACGCAAVPLFLDHAWRSGMFQPGQTIGLVGVEATKWIYAGILVDWTAPTPGATT